MNAAPPVSLWLDPAALGLATALFRTRELN